jgi:hypothetical protein
MKTSAVIKALLAVLVASVAQAAPESSALPWKLTVTPEIKKAFPSSDAIEIREITGTAPHFQVGGVYRVVGVCRQHSLKNATLYIGNTAEPGSEAIVPLADSSLSKALAEGSTEFDCTFELLRPGILHVTIYNADSHDRVNNACAGIYLGDVVFKH